MFTNDSPPKNVKRFNIDLSIERPFKAQIYYINGIIEGNWKDRTSRLFRRRITRLIKLIDSYERKTFGDGYINYDISLDYKYVCEGEHHRVNYFHVDGDSENNSYIWTNMCPTEFLLSKQFIRYTNAYYPEAGDKIYICRK